MAYMNKDTREEYFKWLISFVYKDNYTRLFNKLYNTPYDYILPMDGNREADGISLRYRFADSMNVDQRIIAIVLDRQPCSVLEMMVALAIRCEEDIMYDPNYGDRTSIWFWEMINSLGLTGMTDNQYDEAYTEDVIQHFLNNNYSRTGRGGLFTVCTSPTPMYQVDIWTQMNEYLNTLKGENHL